MSVHTGHRSVTWGGFMSDEAYVFMGLEDRESEYKLK